MVLTTLVADARRVLNQQARYPTTEEVVAALNRGQADYFGFLIGSTKLYQPGRPVPQVSAGLTARVEEELRPFKLTSSLTVTADGEMPLPVVTPAFAYPMRLTLTFADGSTTASAGVKWVSELQWDGRVADLIAPPTIYYPIGRTTATGFQVLPAPSTAKLVFYRYPTPMVLAISGQTADGEDIIDEGNSVDCEWPELAHHELLRRALLALGIQLAAVNAVQYAQGQAATPS